MPFARIDIVRGKSADYKRTIGDVVYDAMIDTLKAPANDRFQVISEIPPEGHIADDSYLGITRTQDCVFIQLTLNTGRTTAQKREFYRRGIIISRIGSQISLPRLDERSRCTQAKPGGAA